MSLRAVVVGLSLGLLVAATTYFNDQLIRQTMLIGHHLPVVVFGVVAVLLFAANPLLRATGWIRPFGGGEVAIIAAIALAACGWPGNSFYRGFGPIVGLPAHWNKTQANWIAADAMSFVPGGSGALPPEHVTDTVGFARLLVDAADEPDSAAGRVWALLDERGRIQARRIVEQEAASPRDRRVFVDALNVVLTQPTLYEAAAFACATLPDPLRDQLAAGAAGDLDTFEQRRANRELLATVMPEWVLPAPRGQGALLQGGRPETPAQQLLRDGAGAKGVGLADLPWRAWWPTLLLWGGLALSLGIAALCLALIVHPQWSLRELLPYPIARFVHELGRTEQGKWLPAIAGHRAFWIAFGLIAAVHLLNGLHAYFPELPTVPLVLDLNPLRTLFPNASRVFGSEAYFAPRVYPAVIAFALFLAGSVSFSLGVAHLMFMVLGAFVLAQGLSFDRDYIGGSRVNMLVFGAYLAAFCTIVFIGRRYYANVALSMVGLPRDASTPAYAPRAGWGLLLALASAVLLLYWGGLPLPLAILAVLLIMLLWLVLSRISAETGLFLLKMGWLPVGILTALLGFEAIGPTGYIMLALATMVIVGETREAIMPFLVNGLRLAERGERAALPRAAGWMGLMLVLSLLVAGAASMSLQHNHGLLNLNDAFATRFLPVVPFDTLSRHVSEARAEGALDTAVAASGVERIGLIASEPGAYGWAALGAALVFITAAARLRLPWWPLHPVAFLVWGTWPMFHFSFSLLLGWMIKTAIVSVGGARSYHLALPIAVGVILGEIVSALGWSVVGAVYFFSTGLTPPGYSIFPG